MPVPYPEEWHASNPTKFEGSSHKKLRKLSAQPKQIVSISSTDLTHRHWHQTPFHTFPPSHVLLLHYNILGMIQWCTIIPPQKHHQPINAGKNTGLGVNTQLPPEAPREQVPLQAGATPLHLTTLTLDINKMSGLKSHDIASIWLKNTKYHHFCSLSTLSPSLKAFCHSTSFDSQLGLAVWQLTIHRSIHKASQQFEALPQRPHLYKSKTTLKDH